MYNNKYIIILCMCQLAKWPPVLLCYMSLFDFSAVAASASTCEREVSVANNYDVACSHVASYSFDWCTHDHHQQRWLGSAIMIAKHNLMIVYSYNESCICTCTCLLGARFTRPFLDNMHICTNDIPWT